MAPLYAQGQASLLTPSQPAVSLAHALSNRPTVPARHTYLAKVTENARFRDRRGGCASRRAKARGCDPDASSCDGITALRGVYQLAKPFTAQKRYSSLGARFSVTKSSIPFFARSSSQFSSMAAGIQ